MKITPKTRRALRRLAKMGPRRVDPLAERATLKRAIAVFAENGRVALHTTGMDCDCVEYSGVARSSIPAQVVAVEREIQGIYDAADGPVSVGLMKPSEAAACESISRDLALEAFEDGHPHCVRLA